MKIAMERNSLNLNEKQIKETSHHLVVLAEGVKNYPFETILLAKLKRTNKKIDSLQKAPLVTELDNGSLISWLMMKADMNTFQRHTHLRKGFMQLAKENPKMVSIHFYLPKANQQSWVESAAYVALLNSQDLPNLKKESKLVQLKYLKLYGVNGEIDRIHIEALAEGNTLTRCLTMTPPNDLTPTIYRGIIKKLAQKNRWKHEEFLMPKLKKMGAGAFYSVGQGSEPQDAAIVHLSYYPKGASHTLALVGKGICFDTGGHNLKPAKYMSGMHEDMNGSAVVLGILEAATRSKIKVNIDCWLAIAQNHIGPKAYKQNDVVKALNGMTIEIVHTDAEGRMVLADTLTLASRKKPKAIIDFATLTGCMAVAMGDRYSGALSNKPALACMAVGAGAEVGERIAAFPFDEDYEDDLDSQIADIKQCTLEGGPDHIHAARFLARFVEKDVPWLHIDLSSSNRKGGLGAVESDVNGFGVAFGLAMIAKLTAKN